MKKSILFYTGIFIIFFIAVHFLLYLFHLTFVNVIKIYSYILILIGIVAGSVQLIVNDEDKIINKIVYSSLVIFIELFIFIPFISIYLLLIYQDEYIINIGSQTMVKTIHYKAESTTASYYQYHGFFIRDTNKSFTEIYEEN